MPTPLRFLLLLCTQACTSGNRRLVAALLRWGADVNTPGREGTTPLMCAASAGASPAAVQRTHANNSLANVF